MIVFVIAGAARVHVLSHREAETWVAVCGARTLVPLVVGAAERVTCRACLIG